MTELANVGRTLMAKHSVIMRYYLTGLTAGEIVNRTGLPRCSIDREIDRNTRSNPDLIGRHLKARRKPGCVNRWPRARLVMENREWHRCGPGEWVPMQLNERSYTT